MARENGTLEEVVDALCSGFEGGLRPPGRAPSGMPPPSREAVRRIVEMLRSVLFPGFYGEPQFPVENARFYVGATLDAAAKDLAEQIERSLCFFCEKEALSACAGCREKAAETAAAFCRTLPRIQKLLMTDVQAAYEGDPAATCPAETVFCYPGILAVTNQRLAHELYTAKVPLLPRIITELAHSATGIDIHPGAAIGKSFFIDHGTGVVIGETCTIGEGVRIYQGVTLGAKSFPLDKDGKPIKGVKRHPDVEDGVTIYAEATILGPVRIGRGSTIGGNVWLTHDVPPGSKVSQTGTER